MPKPAPRRAAPRPFTASTTLDDVDTDWLIQIMRAGGHSTPEGAIRTALWKYARHLNLNVPVDAFKLKG